MNKQVYRVRNWPEYNRALKNRGSITFWFEESSLKQWSSTNRTGKRGRPEKYSDVAIEAGLTLKALLKLPFRATEGFIRSMMQMLSLAGEAPDYTLLCKRQKHLKIPLKCTALRPGEKLNIVVDTTGLKIHGEGEWKVRQHGYVKHRVWRKLHIAVDESSQEVVGVCLTDLGIQDCQGFEVLLDQIEHQIGNCKADGTYDRFSCYQRAAQRKFELITPPQKNARTSEERRDNKKKASPEAVKKRDEVIERVRSIGRRQWKIESGYHQRSLAETAIFRFKQLLGPQLSARKFEHQALEVIIKCNLLNKMASLGLPQLVAIH